MRLIYLTSGPRERVLEALLSAGHEIEEIVALDPERFPRVVPTLDLAAERNIPVRLLHRRAELADLTDVVSGRNLLSAGFGWLLPGEVLQAAALCLNVHGTLLPEFGGARTLNWVIASGATESGVTVHLMDESADSGAIVLQRRFPISRFDTVVSLQRKTLELEPEVVLEALTLLESDRAEPRPQDAAGVRRWPDRVPEHSEIDPSRPLIDLYDEIRAADPDRFPAYFVIDGERVCIRLWRPDKPADEPDLV